MGTGRIQWRRSSIVIVIFIMLCGKQFRRQEQLLLGRYCVTQEHDLKDPSDRRFIISNNALLKLTSEKRFLAFGVAKIIAPHVIKKP